MLSASISVIILITLFPNLIKTITVHQNNNQRRKSESRKKLPQNQCHFPYLNDPCSVTALTAFTFYILLYFHNTIILFTCYYISQCNYAFHMLLYFTMQLYFSHARIHLTKGAFILNTNAVNLGVAISIWAQTGPPVIACTWQSWEVKGKPRWI